MAAELTTQLVTLAANSGYDVRTDLFGTAATAYTRSSAFPGQFAMVNRFAHRWMFTDSVSSDVDSQGRWVIDLAPMLADSSFQQTLAGLRHQGAVEPADPADRERARRAAARAAAAGGYLGSVGQRRRHRARRCVRPADLAVARRRGKALVALGVSALLVGAAGWAGLEVGRRYAGTALSDTCGDIRQIADSLVGHAVSSLHQWLNLTLAVGGGLVVVGVILTLLGGIGHRPVREPALG